MKTIKFFLLLICVFYSYKTISQNSSKFGIGINSGYNISSITTDNNYKHTELLSFSFNSLSGINTGLFFEYYITPKFSIATICNFNQKGYTEIRSVAWDPFALIGAFENSIFYYHLDYLTFPLLAKPRIGNNPQLYLIFGPFYSRLLNAYRIYPNYFQWEARPPYKSDVVNYFSKNDYGIIGGLGLEYKINSKIHIAVDGEFAKSLTNCDDGISYHPYFGFKDYYPKLLKLNSISANLKLIYMF